MLNTLNNKRSLLQLNTILSLSDTVVSHLPKSSAITIQFNAKAPTNLITFGVQELKFESDTYFYAGRCFPTRLTMRYRTNVLIFVPKRQIGLDLYQLYDS